MMTEERLIKKLYEACKCARNHLEACMSGRINFTGCGKSASYPLVMEAIELVDAHLSDPHMTVRELIEKLSKEDWDSLVFVGGQDNHMMKYGMSTDPATGITVNRQKVGKEKNVSCVHITSA